MMRDKPNTEPGRHRRGQGKARVQTLGGLVVVLVLAALGFASNQPRAAETERGHSASTPTAQDQAPRLKHVIEHARVLDQRTGHVLEGRIDLSDTLERIATGGHYPHRNDGAVFQNRPPPGKQTPALPRKQSGYYREYVHPTPGISGPGPQRIVVGQAGEHYYTPDHYETFIALHE